MWNGKCPLQSQWCFHELKNPAYPMHVASNIHDPGRHCDLVTHIQDGAEDVKASVARVLHDDVGGLLVAALMDLVWVENHPAGPQATSTEKLRRIKTSLRAAIDLERQIVEELRPSLLDHVGLFAALKWHLKAGCDKAGVASQDQLPPVELALRPAASIALYRIAEESLSFILKNTVTSIVALEVELVDDRLNIHFTGDGSLEEGCAKSAHHALAALRHRIDILDGELQINEGITKGSRLSASIPLANLK
jgi:signal transduction histidine kinase